MDISSLKKELYASSYSVNETLKGSFRGNGFYFKTDKNSKFGTFSVNCVLSDVLDDKIVRVFVSDDIAQIALLDKQAYGDIINDPSYFVTSKVKDRQVMVSNPLKGKIIEMDAVAALTFDDRTGDMIGVNHGEIVEKWDLIKEGIENETRKALQLNASLDASSKPRNIEKD